MSHRVAIVGGGFSGLFGAYLLERALHHPPEVVVLESSPRLGGRIWTSTIGPQRTPYEAGAAEFYNITGAPYLRRLVEQLGLPTRPMRATPVFFVDGRRLDSDEDFREAFGDEAMERLEAFWAEATALRPPERYASAGHPRDNEHPWSRLTFAEVLRRIGHPIAERFTAVQVHSDLCASPGNTNGVFGFDNLLIDHPGYCEMYTISGGNEQLVTRLAEEVRSPVRTRAPVQRVTPLADGGFRIEHRAGRETVELDVDGLLVTLPPPCLVDVEWGDARTSAALHEHVRHHDHSAAYLRVTLLFESRFWQDELPEDYFVIDAFRGTTVYDQSPEKNGPGPGLLSWLIAGNPAEEMCEWEDEDVLDAVLERLPPPLAGARARLIDHRIDRWKGAYGVSRLPGGSPLLPLERRHRPAPDHPGLAVVGDYLYDATISGAVDACARGIAYLLAGIGGAEQPAAETLLDRCGLRREDPERETGTTKALPFLRTYEESPRGQTLGDTRS